MTIDIKAGTKYKAGLVSEYLLIVNQFINILLRVIIETSRFNRLQCFA